MPRPHTVTILSLCIAASLGLCTRAHAQTLTIDEPSMSAQDTRREAAAQLYSEGRYMQAAAAYEALWHDHGSARDLFNVGMAHEVLGHDAHAYVYLRRAQTSPGVTPDVLAQIAARLGPLAARTTPLAVNLATDDLDAGARVTLTYRDLHGVPDPQRPPLQIDPQLFEAPNGGVEIHVERADWKVEISTPTRHAEQTVKITEQMNSADVEVRLTPDRTIPRVQLPAIEMSWHEPPSPVQIVLKKPKHDRRLSLGLAGLSVATLAGGAVLLGITGDRWAPFRDAYLEAADANVQSATQEKMRRNYHMQSLGSGLLGAGFGLLVGSLVTRKPHRARVWVAPLLLGGAALAGGLAAQLFVNDAHADALDRNEFGNSHGTNPTLRSQVEMWRLEAIAADAALGLGGGLVASSLIALICGRSNRHKLPRYSLRPHASLTATGLILQGRF